MLHSFCGFNLGSLQIAAFISGSSKHLTTITGWVKTESASYWHTTAMSPLTSYTWWSIYCVSFIQNAKKMDIWNLSGKHTRIHTTYNADYSLWGLLIFKAVRVRQDMVHDQPHVILAAHVEKLWFEPRTTSFRFSPYSSQVGFDFRNRPLWRWQDAPGVNKVNFIFIVTNT